MYHGLTLVFSALQVLLSDLWEQDKMGGRRREGGKKGIDKERKEGRRNKENQRQDKKEI